MNKKLITTAKKILNKNGVTTQVLRMCLEAPTTVDDVFYELKIKRKKIRDVFRYLEKKKLIYIWGRPKKEFQIRKGVFIENTINVYFVPDEIRGQLYDKIDWNIYSTLRS